MRTIALTVLSLLSFGNLAYASCPAADVDDIFTALIYEPTTMESILPLGNMGPASHTLPVHHLYYTTKPDGQGGKLFTDIISPADMQIVAVEKSVNDPNNFNLHLYYRHNGTTCDDIRMYIEHLNSLDDQLFGPNFGDFTAADPDVAQVGESLYKFGLAINTNAGTVLGQSGGSSISANFDVGLIDRRKAMVGYAKPERYDPTLVTAAILQLFPDPDLTAARIMDVIPDRNFQRCAIDYFTATLKAEQEALLGTGTEPAFGVPICQTHNRDAAGTMAGNWFSTPHSGMGLASDSWLLTHESTTAALGPYNVNPERHILSLNQDVFLGAPLTEDPYFYTPNPPGTLINPTADETIPGRVYCWERLAKNDITILQGVIIGRKVPNAEQIELEFLPGGPLCRMHPDYALGANRVTYFR